MQNHFCSRVHSNSISVPYLFPSNFVHDSHHFCKYFRSVCILSCSFSSFHSCHLHSLVICNFFSIVAIAVVIGESEIKARWNLRDSTSFPGFLSYSRSVGTGRRDPWEQVCCETIRYNSAGKQVYVLLGLNLLLSHNLVVAGTVRTLMDVNTATSSLRASPPFGRVVRSHTRVTRKSRRNCEGALHSRPQSPSPSFLCHVVRKRGRLQIKPSGSGDENGARCNLRLLYLGKVHLI